MNLNRGIAYGNKRLKWDPDFPHTIIKMSRIQQKITYFNKNQENHNLNGKTKSNVGNTRMTEMLELSDKDLKRAILKSLWYTITNSFETNGKKTATENLMKEIEVT